MALVTPLEPRHIGLQIQYQALTIMGIGGAVGAVAGLLSLLSGSLDEAALTITRVYQIGLPLACGAMMLLTIWLSQDNGFRVEKDHQPRLIYQSLPSVLITTTAAAILGTLGASIAFLFPAVGFPSLFKGFAEIQSIILRSIGLSSFVFLLGSTLVVGLVAAVFAYLWMDLD